MAELRGRAEADPEEAPRPARGGEGRHRSGQGPRRGGAERLPAARGGAERAGHRAGRGGAAAERVRGVPHPGDRRPLRRPRPPRPAPAAAPTPAPEPRRFRELSDTDREKMERLEHLANRERSRAQELSAEVRRLKGRTETQARVYTVIKGELDLLKDKFKALEKRLNRTLLERDLLRRAIRDLEKKSGLAADRTELTADEVAASDRSVEERAAAEAAEIARRTRPPEPAEPAVRRTPLPSPRARAPPLSTGRPPRTPRARHRPRCSPGPGSTWRRPADPDLHSGPAAQGDAGHAHLPRPRGGAGHLRPAHPLQRQRAPPESTGNPAGQPGLPAAGPGRRRARLVPAKPGPGGGADQRGDRTRRPAPRWSGWPRSPTRRSCAPGSARSSPR